MAFGSISRGGSRDAGVVKLVADTGEFNSKIEAAERIWRENVGQMSREALKLDVAQDRLKSSLARYGSEATQTKRATIQLKDAEEQATRAARGLDRANDGARSSMGGLRKAALAAVSAVGVYGLGSAIRTTLNAAKESELVLGQTRLAVEAAGLSWNQYAGQINVAIRQQSRLGFDQEALLRTFSTFVTRTHDVTKALQLNSLAANVARGRYIDLESASKIVLKASLGMSGQLRRLGIDVDKNSTSQELLAKLTEAYGTRAKGALGSATASQERLNASIKQSEIVIGSGLTPTIAALSNRLADYLDDAQNQERLQKQVNAAVKDGTAIVRGLAGGLRAVGAVLGPVVKGMGGVENATKAAFGLVLLRRLGLLRLGITGIGLASVTTGGQMALMGNEAAVAGVKVGRLASLAGALNVASLVGVSAFIAAQALHAKFDESNTITRAQLADPQTRARIEKAIGPEGLAKLDASVPGPKFKGQTGEGATFGITPLAAARKVATRAKGDGLTRLQRLLLAEQDPGNDLTDAKNLLAYYQSVVKNGKLTGDKLFQAKTDFFNQLQRVNSIQDQIGQDAKAAADKRLAKIKAQQAAAASYRKKNLDAVARALKTTGPYATTSAGFRGGMDPSKLKDAGGITEGQAQAFLDQLSGDIRQYAGNTRPVIIQNFHSPVSAFKAGRDAELAARAVRA